MPTRPTVTIDAIVFDLGGVLIDWNPRYLYRRVFDDEAAIERFLAEICTAEWNAAQDAGRSWADAVALLTGQYPEFAEQIALYDQRWSEMLGGPIRESVDVLAAVRETGIGLFALTNWSAEKFPIARTLPDYRFLDWFDGIVVSGEERLVKPDPRIFRLMFDRFGLVPESTAYVDDSLTNVGVASELGMTAFHFTGADRLRRDLEATAVLPARQGTGEGRSAV